MKNLNSNRIYHYDTCPVFFTIRIASLINGAKFVGPAIRTFGVILLYARPLNVMQLDEEQAQQLGINVERVKLVLLATATLITAAASLLWKGRRCLSVL